MVWWEGLSREEREVVGGLGAKMEGGGGIELVGAWEQGSEVPGLEAELRGAKRIE